MNMIVKPHQKTRTRFVLSWRLKWRAEAVGERKEDREGSPVRTLEHSDLREVAPVHHLGGVHGEGSQDADEAHTKGFAHQYSRRAHNARDSPKS